MQDTFKQWEREFDRIVLRFNRSQQLQVVLKSLKVMPRSRRPAPPVLDSVQNLMYPELARALNGFLLASCTLCTLCSAIMTLAGWKKCFCRGSILPQRSKTGQDLLHKFFKSKPDSGSLQEQFVHSARRSTSFVLFIATFPLLPLPHSPKFKAGVQPEIHVTVFCKLRAWASLSLLDTCKTNKFTTILLLTKVKQLKRVCPGKLPSMFLWFDEFQFWGVYLQQVTQQKWRQPKKIVFSTARSHRHTNSLLFVASHANYSRKPSRWKPSPCTFRWHSHRTVMNCVGPFLWGHSNFSGSAACLKVRDELTWTGQKLSISVSFACSCWESSDIERLGPAVPSVRIQIKHAKAILFGLGPWCVLQVFRAMLCRDLGDSKISRDAMEVRTCPRYHLLQHQGQQQLRST